MRPAGLCAALLAIACSTSLDVDRARRWLEPPEQPKLPALEENPSIVLPAPEGLRATSGELRQVPLRWDPLLSGEVAGYVIERSDRVEGPFLRIAAVPGHAQTTYLDAGPSRWPGASDEEREDLEDGQTLSYRVRAFSPAGALSTRVSEVVAASTAATPEPPDGLRAWSHQPRRVPLAWQGSTDAKVAGYVVERSPASRGPFELLAEIEGRHSTVFVDRGLGDLRVFHYRVAAVNRAGGQGEASKPVRAVTKAEPLPPIGLRVAERRLGANRIAWDPNVESDLAGYRLLRTREGADAPEPVASLSRDQTAALDPAVGADEDLSYTLVALDVSGLESEPSEPIEVASVGYELTASVRGDGVHLSWNPRRAENWELGRVLLDGRFGTTELGTGDAGRFVHTGVRPGRRYRYRVVLESRDGRQAPPSSPVAIRIPED